VRNGHCQREGGTEGGATDGRTRRMQTGGGGFAGLRVSNMGRGRQLTLVSGRGWRCMQAGGFFLSSVFLLIDGGEGSCYRIDSCEGLRSDDDHTTSCMVDLLFSEYSVGNKQLEGESARGSGFRTCFAVGLMRVSV
jgi:hypothetical protein